MYFGLFTILVPLFLACFLTLIIDRKVLAEKYIMTAAKLIAPAIETSFATGFDWSVTVNFRRL